MSGESTASAAEGSPVRAGVLNAGSGYWSPPNSTVPDCLVDAAGGDDTVTAVLRTDPQRLLARFGAADDPQREQGTRR